MKQFILLLGLLFAFASCLPSWYALQEQLLDGCSTNFTLINNANNVNGATDSQGRVLLLGGRSLCSVNNVATTSSFPVLRYFDFNVGHWTVVWTYSNAGPSPRNDNFIWVDKFDNIWIYGGLNDEFNALCDFWMYNTTSNQWIDYTPADTSQVFNDRGVESATTYPGCLRSSAMWYTHDDHSLWLSHGYTSTFGVPAMFRYNINSGKWTWAAGSKTDTQPLNQFPDTGSSFNNYPCSRFAPLSAVDDQGNLWFFGGDTSGAFTNDLWKFDRNAGWAIMDGGRKQITDSFTINYGTNGEFSVGAWPYGATYSSMAYAGNNIIALKGGYQDEYGDYVDEEWYYNITSNLWMNTHNGTYTTVIQALGQADPLNRPGTNWFSRVTSSGALWVIGDKTGSVFVKKLSCDSIFNPCNELATCSPDPWTAVKCTCKEGYEGTGIGANGCTVPPPMAGTPSTPSSASPISAPSPSTTPSAVPKATSTASQYCVSVVSALSFVFTLL